MKKPKKATAKEKWGPSEWFGQDIFSMNDATRLEIASRAMLSYEEAAHPCPDQSNLTGQERICSKPGGICSVQRYATDTAGRIVPTGIQVAICPHRITSKAVLNEIAPKVLGVNVAPVLVKEVPYSISLVNTLKSGKPATAGRIDWLLVDQNNTLNFCAIETQSVYMSGKSQKNTFSAFIKSNGAMVMPPDYRRPDYKSSVPKRLAPQLESKARQLYATGRKTVVIVDEFVHGNMHTLREVDVPAAYALDPQQTAAYKFNESEVIFAIVSIADGNLKVSHFIYCKIDAAISALNAVAAMNKSDFEAVVGNIVEMEKKKEKSNKVFSLN
jgi:hypothetical protein